MVHIKYVSGGSVEEQIRENMNLKSNFAVKTYAMKTKGKK